MYVYRGESLAGNYITVIRVRVKGPFCAGLTRRNTDLFQASAECQSYKCEEHDAVCTGTRGIYCLPVYNPEERVKYYFQLNQPTSCSKFSSLLLVI
jgi:hypothetical protein